jgi:hypothetical protein
MIVNCQNNWFYLLERMKVNRSTRRFYPHRSKERKASGRPDKRWKGQFE